MARGWESKSIEDQQAQATQEDSRKARARLTPEEAARQRRVESLRLARTRILQQLQGVANDRHRATLQAALAELDRQLLNLKNP